MSALRVDDPHPLSARIFLRPIRPEDLDVLVAWENDPAVWAATDFSAWAEDERPPYSRETLAQFIDNQQLGVEHTGQLRLVICLCDDASAGSQTSAPRPLGFVDLFDYDPRTLSAEVGMLIYRAADRGRGYGAQALVKVCEYASEELGMHELRCTVKAENAASRRIFEKCGFIFEENRGRVGDLQTGLAIGQYQKNFTKKYKI